METITHVGCAIAGLFALGLLWAVWLVRRAVRKGDREFERQLEQWRQGK